MKYRGRKSGRKEAVMAAVLALCLGMGTGCGGTGMPAGNVGENAPEETAGESMQTADAGENAAGESVQTAGAGESAPGEAAGENAQTADAGENATEAGRKKTESIAFGEGSEWEFWTDYLYQTAADEKFIFAFIETGEDSADFSWEVCDDRESLVDVWFREKDAERGGEDTLTWHFLKIGIGSGVCGMDIYDYFKRNLSEEGYIVHAWTMDEGNAYGINLDWKKAYEEEYRLATKRKIIVKNGYLYLLSCEDVTDDNRSEVTEIIQTYENLFERKEYTGGWFMDEDTIYWSDHTARTTTLEEPERRFVEERASDATWPDKLMGYFGLVSEAEYWVRLAPDMPEMTIAFRLKADLLQKEQEIYLFNGFVMDETYEMEIRTVEGEKLIQKTDVMLSIERKDLISFEDLDHDGYLDMRILYPTHESGADEMYVEKEEYWVWEPDMEKMICVSDSELQARRSEREETEEEEIPVTQLSIIPVVVEKGDSLWKISEEYYGNGKYWIKIYEYNRSLIGDNPSLIYAGTELILPWLRDWD